MFQNILLLFLTSFLYIAFGFGFTKNTIYKNNYKNYNSYNNDNSNHNIDYSKPYWPKWTYKAEDIYDKSLQNYIIDGDGIERTNPGFIFDADEYDRFEFEGFGDNSGGNFQFSNVRPDWRDELPDDHADFGRKHFNEVVHTNERLLQRLSQPRY